MLKIVSFISAGLWLVAHSLSAYAQPSIDFDVQQDRLVISTAGRSLATYVYSDKDIPRPYFTDVHALTGQQLTRNHPPIEGQDATDHATMHPGIWLAFGDLDGVDFWRNKSRIVHRKFAQAPHGSTGRGAFTEIKEYLRPDGSVVCQETFNCQFIVPPVGGYFIIGDSVFESDKGFYFGDQEEMGLGVRLATPLAEKNGGRLVDQMGRSGAQEIWSQAASWCDYSGFLDGNPLGITVMMHPENFRPSWWHARDYGFMAANPFGRQAMKKGALSRVEVQAGDQFRLRYGIWNHSGAELSHHAAIDRAYASYLQLAAAASSNSEN